VPQSIVNELRACDDVITETDYKMQEIFKALQKVNDMADETPESIMEAERDGKGRRIEQGLGNRD
jgi:ppGpp synthetase/RelA/SpoT-type nucleotidyltranferase